MPNLNLKTKPKWDKEDFGRAMANAVFQHAPRNNIRQMGEKLTFNGFWRDGHKRNVCIWPEKGTWCDLNENESSGKGGVKSFAEVVFKMKLPEFMERYGNPSPRLSLLSSEPKRNLEELPADYAHNIFSKIRERNTERPNIASQWLHEVRNFPEPPHYITSGVSYLFEEDLELFAPQHRPFIRHRLSLGKNIIVPLRGADSTKIKNLFFRAIEEVPKKEKARVLQGCGGLTEPDGTPRTFGYPYGLIDYPKVVLCEGMADYFAAEILLDCGGKFLPIGAPGTKSLKNWSQWLAKSDYRGEVHIVYQLDTARKGYGAGQSAAIEAKKILSASNNIKAFLFDWNAFLKNIPDLKKIPGDLAEVFEVSRIEFSALSQNFYNTLQSQIN